jgi:hypothetical protein
LRRERAPAGFEPLLLGHLAAPGDVGGVDKARASGLRSARVKALGRSTSVILLPEITLFLPRRAGMVR